jgi:WD40 repeat protein
VQRGAVVQEFRADTNEVNPWRFLAHGHKLMIAQPVPGWTDRLWDLTTERELHAWPSGPDAKAGAFSPDERWFVHLFFGGASHLKDMVSGHDTDLELDLRQAMGAAFSPDGKTFAAASWRGYARLWETVTWQEVKTLPCVQLAFNSVAFSPDGSRLMTGSNGQEAIQLWDTESYQELLALEGRGSLFSSPAFSPDGSLLGSMNQQGVLHLWRAPSWAEIQAAEEAEAKAQ